MVLDDGGPGDDPGTMRRLPGRPEWLTREEFAALARISTVTARRWARQGIGPTAHRVRPRLVRYRRAEVDAWLAARPVAGSLGRGVGGGDD